MNGTHGPISTVLKKSVELAMAMKIKIIFYLSFRLNIKIEAIFSHFRDQPPIQDELLRSFLFIWHGGLQREHEMLNFLNLLHKQAKGE